MYHTFSEIIKLHSCHSLASAFVVVIGGFDLGWMLYIVHHSTFHQACACQELYPQESSDHAFIFQVFPVMNRTIRVGESISLASK